MEGVEGVALVSSQYRARGESSAQESMKPVRVRGGLSPGDACLVPAT